MAQLPQAFDPSTAPAPEPFAPLPEGEYTFLIVETDVVETKKSQEQGTKDGYRMTFTAEVQGGQYGGRKVFGSFNIMNPNPQAVAISQGQMKALSEAIGHAGQITDSSQIENKPFRGRVKVKPGQNGYEPRAEIVAFAPVGNQPAPPSQSATPPPAPAQPNGATPWG